MSMEAFTATAGVAIQIDRAELARIKEQQREAKASEGALCSEFIGFETEATVTTEASVSTNESKAQVRKRPVPVTSVMRYNVPWMNKNSRRYSTMVTELLHQEIVDFVNYVSPTEEERFARSEAVKRLEQVVKGIWEDASVQAFGSFDSQLFLPSSDLDVVVIYEEDSQADEHAKAIPLKKLAKALLKASIPIPESLKLITKARVPIIKYMDNQTDFEIDVCFNVSSGLEAAQFMRKEMASQPAVRPLTLVLKHFLGMRSLNEVFHGGLGSYSIMCLVISFLQMHPLVQTGLIRAHENLGVLLMELFELYGRNFNAEAVGIDIRNGGLYFSKEEYGWINESKPHLLCIIDPQNEDNDISKGSFAYGAVRSSFEHAFNVLKCAISELEHVQRKGHSDNHLPSILGSIITLDQKLLRHRYYIQQTANL